MKKWLLGLALLGGCVTTEATEKKSAKVSADVAAADKLRAVLAALPRCEPGAAAGLLAVNPTMCTKMFCDHACCNHCGWAATLETKNGQKQPVSDMRAREVLQVSDSALECEIDAWAKVLATQSLAVEGTACVVR